MGLPGDKSKVIAKATRAEVQALKYVATTYDITIVAGICGAVCTHTDLLYCGLGIDRTYHLEFSDGGAEWDG